MCDPSGVKALLGEVEAITMQLTLLAEGLQEGRFKLCEGVDTILGLGLIQALGSITPFAEAVEFHAIAHEVPHSPAYLSFCAAREVTR